MQSKDAHVCRISTPDNGRYISIRRGSGLFIADWAFGDASKQINMNNVLRFLHFNRIIAKFGDTSGSYFYKNMKKKLLKSLLLVTAMLLGLSVNAQIRAKWTVPADAETGLCSIKTATGFGEKLFGVNCDAGIVEE